MKLRFNVMRFFKIHFRKIEIRKYFRKQLLSRIDQLLNTFQIPILLLLCVVNTNMYFSVVLKIVAKIRNTDSNLAEIQPEPERFLNCIFL